MTRTVLTSVLAAFGASLCCTGPLLMLLLGSTAVGAFSFFEHIRPYASVVAVGLLGFALYRSYWKQSKEDCCETDKEKIMKKNNNQRRTLWGITPIVLALVLFPYYNGLLYGGDKDKHEDKNAAVTEWSIEGMTCEGCARGLQGSMAAVKGVKSCKVDYESKTMICTVDPSVVRAEAIPGLVERTGYKAAPKKGAKSDTKEPSSPK